MNTSVIEVVPPAWPVPVVEPKYAKELRRVAIRVFTNGPDWSGIKGAWEVGTKVVMLNDALAVAKELQERVDQLTKTCADYEKRAGEIEKSADLLMSTIADERKLYAREKRRLEDEVDASQLRIAKLKSALSMATTLRDEFRKLEATDGNDPIRCSRMHFGGWASTLDDVVASAARDHG